MTEFRVLTDDSWVSGQLEVDDVHRAADQGVDLIVNNRPDGEEPGQLSGEQIEAAARAAGIRYAAVPIRGRPTEAQAREVEVLLTGRSGKALLFCRSGMRSAAVWAMAAVAAGAISPEDARALAASAGYDLSGLPL